MTQEITITIPAKASERVRNLAERLGITNAEVVGRALAVYELLHKGKLEGFSTMLTKEGEASREVDLQ